MNNQQGLPRKWTELGYRLKAAHVQALKADFQAKTRALDDGGAHSQPSSVEQQSDNSGRRADRDQAYTRWTLADDELAGLRMVVVSNKAKLVVSTGMQVRGKWVDHPDVAKEGTEESFIFGGQGESWEEGDVRVIKSDGPLGKAIIRSEVGDERTVLFKGYEAVFEIIDVRIPDMALLERRLMTTPEPTIGNEKRP